MKTLLLTLTILTKINLSADASLTLDKIQQLDVQIEQLQTQLLNTRTEYGLLQTQLKGNEEQIGEVAHRLEILHSALKDKQNTLIDLKRQQQFQQQQLEQQRKQLAQQIRAAYTIGRQDYLKLWLNQENPFRMGRLLSYYDYINRARTQQIQSLHNTLKTIEDLKNTIDQEKTNLDQMAIEEKNRVEHLQLTQQQRQLILAQLTRTLESQEQELARLQEEKQQLATLLETLDNTYRFLPHFFGKPTLFDDLKGKLPKPVEGQISHHFGERLIGSLKWQGIFIEAPAGQKVQAIAAGRVVFAQWFRNLGLLIILDHGKNYMSLYAHNQSLYKNVGDIVKAQETIASVGNSGGRKTTGLYFEIRHKGNPINPVEWINLSLKP